MIKRILLPMVTLFVACSSNAEFDRAYTETVARFAVSSLTNENLEAIAVVALSKDMHLRIGYQSQMHSGRLVLESLRLIPAYLVADVYSRSALPQIIYIFDSSHYSLDDPYLSPDPNKPFVKLRPYPDKTAIRLVFLKREDILKHSLFTRGGEPEFVSYANEARQTGASLAEVMRFVGMDQIVTSESVFALLRHHSSLPIHAPTPVFPPVPSGEKTMIPESMVFHMDDSPTVTLPSGFANDLKTITTAFHDNRKAPLGYSDFSTEPGRMIADMLRLYGGMATE